MMVQPTENNNHLTYLPDVPTAFNRFRLTAAVPYFLNLKEGKAFSQELRGYDFSIWVHRFQLNEPLRLPLLKSQERLSILASMEGTFQLSWEHAADKLMPNDCMLFFTSLDDPLFIELQPGHHLLFHIDYSLPFIQPYLAHSAMLTDVITKAATSDYLTQQYHVVSLARSVQRMIETLLLNQDQNQINRVAFLKSLADETFKHYLLKTESVWTVENSHLPGIEIVHKVAEYIALNADEKFTVLDIANRFHIPVQILSSEFKRYYHLQIHDFQLKVRIDMAVDLIKLRKGTFKEIAYECGFYDGPHFMRTFKQFKGMSPKEFLKTLNK